MAWTQADADAIREAIKKLALGDREVTVSFTGSGGSRSATYALADLDGLRSLLAQITRELGGGAPYRLAAMRKGL